MIHNGAASIPTIAVFLFVIFAVTGPARAERLPCFDVWPGLADNIATRALQCERVGTMAHGGRQFAFYTVRGWTHPRIDEIIRGIGKGIRDTVDTLDPIHRVPPTSFFLTDLSALQDIYGAAIGVDGPGCGSALYAPAFEGGRRDLFDRVEFTVAHELAHCIQFDAYPDRSAVRPLYSDWWVEGGAEYLANVVYPDFDMEHDYIELFNRVSFEKPLLEMKYEAFLFFQYLENVGYTPRRIFELFRHMATADGWEAQRRGAASIPDIDRLFNGFAKAFVEHKIHDSSGDLLPYTMLFGDTNMIEGNRSLLSSARPFTLTRFELSFRGGGEFTTTIDESESPGILEATANLAEPWGPIPDAISLGCGEQKSYFVIMTSVDPTDRRYEVALDARFSPNSSCKDSVTAPASPAPGANGSCNGAVERPSCIVGEWKVHNAYLARWMGTMFRRYDQPYTYSDVPRGRASMAFHANGEGGLILENLAVLSETSDTSTEGLTVNTTTSMAGIERFIWSTSGGTTLHRCPYYNNISLWPVISMNGTPLPPMDPIPLSELRQNAGAPPAWSGEYQCNGDQLFFKYIADDAAGRQMILLERKR
jgi:hypothetical protein